MTDLNLANALFDGFNDKEGLMICGYEWGEEANKDENYTDSPDMSQDCTFSNKSLRYGEVAKTWIKYDKKIRTWFSTWGHPLNENGLGDDFDKCIIQTNWALGSNSKSQDISYYLEDENLENFDLNIDLLAKELNMSRTVFFNKLKSLTGYSPVEFVREVRFERAAEYMRDTQLTVSEISYRVGIEDPRYFSRCFKQKFGATPSEYRLKNGNNN